MAPSTPRPWHHSQGACPPILGITLHRPWSWAFFSGAPGTWKDVENRKRGFPEVPPGAWLALHNGAHWDSVAENAIRGRVHGLGGIGPQDCPRGQIVGVVRVREITRGVPPAWRQSSRWRLPWETAIWLESERHLLPKPIPHRMGWFNAWHLPPEAYTEIVAQLGPVMGLRP